MTEDSVFGASQSGLTAAARPYLHVSWRMRPIVERARRLPFGRLDLTLPNGVRMVVEGERPGPSATLHIQRDRFARRLLAGGAVGFADAYLDGDWDSPDLVALLRFGWANRAAIGIERRGVLARFFDRIGHWRRQNSRRGSRRNIAAHYDLGNEFYCRWLSADMTYSAALFAAEADDQTLEAAQRAKYARIADLAGLMPGMTVLEIGCGWGGFAEYAVAERGARVVALTLSERQRDFAQKRLAASGLGDRAEIRLQDYRDVTGQFDAVASIEMIEAVGEQFWPTYFDKICEVLRPGGRVAIQSITMPDDRFERYRRNPDFIQRRVFPGGMLPSRAAITRLAQNSGLAVDQDDGFALDYAVTLAQWRSSFASAWSEIAPLGFDDRFRRLWLYYLAYCEAAFRDGAIDLRQIAFQRSI